jgi:hypothetical protein
MKDSDKTQFVNTTTNNSSSQSPNNSSSQNPSNSNQNTPDTTDKGKNVKGAVLGATLGAVAGVAAGTVFSDEIRDGAESVQDFVSPDESAIVEGSTIGEVVELANGNTEVSEPTDQAQVTSDHATTTTASVSDEVPVSEPHIVESPIEEATSINEIPTEPENHEVVSGMVFEDTNGVIQVTEFVDIEGDGFIDNVNTYEYTADGEIIAEEHLTTQELAEANGVVDIGHLDMGNEIIMDDVVEELDGEILNSNETDIVDLDSSSEAELSVETDNIDWDSVENDGASEMSTEAMNEIDDSSSPDEAYQDLLNESDFSSDDYYSNNEDYSGSDFV